MMPLRRKVLVALAVAALAAAFAVAAAIALRGRPFVAAAIALAALALAALVADALWVAFDLGGTMLRSGRRDRPEVALTFDDGPGEDTPALLDALDGAGVKATFFVLGRAAEACPEIVRETARRGHLVALHGHSHRKLHLASRRGVREQIDRAERAVRAAGVVPAPFFRPPHGFKGIALRRELRRRGLVLTGWTRGVWDTERPGAAAIVERACGRMRGGEILLLHDGCGESWGTGAAPPSARRDQTVAAVGELVRRWREAGFRFVTLDAIAPDSLSSRRGGARRAIGIAILAVLCGLALRDLDVRELGRALAAARLPLLLAGAALNVAGLVVQAARWHALVRPASGGARLGDAFRSLVGGYALGLLLPARAADVARIHLHARESGISVAALVGTVALDHAVNGATMLAGLGLFALVAPLPAWARHAGLVSLVAFAAATLAALVLHRHGDGGAAGGGRLAQLLGKLRSGLAAVGDGEALARAAAAAIGAWVVEVLVALASLAAFGLPATASVAVLLVLATTLSAAASVSPGNTGAFELAVVLVLAGLGVPSGPALAFALGYHAAHLVPVAILGGGWLLAGGLAPVRSEAPAPQGEGLRPAARARADREPQT